MRVIALGVLFLILIGAFLAASFLVRRIARQSPKVRRRVAFFLFLLMLLGLIEFITGYTLAVPYASVVTPLVFLAAYVLELLLLWHWGHFKWNWNRVAAALGLGAPMAFFIADLRTLGLALAVFFGVNGFRPVAEGRLSSNLTYRVMIDHNLFGTDYYGYHIYRNPAWFPLVEKRIARGPLECEDTQTDLKAGGFKLTLRPPIEKNAVRVACIYRGTESPPMKIDID